MKISPSNRAHETGDGLKIQHLLFGN